MNKKLTIALPLLALLVFGLVGQTLAQTRVPGVQAGDYFTYTITSHWNSDNASAVVPADLLAINNTLYHKATVIIVLGTNVTWDEVMHFVNGTEKDPIRVTQDVDSGSFYGPYWLIAVVDANLGANDLLHPSGNDFWKVNQTISRPYANGNRDTNVVSFSAPMLDSTNTTTIGNNNSTYCFDKATGMLVERREEAVRLGETASIDMLLKETNLWTVGEAAPLPLPLPMPILIAIIVVIIVVIVSIIFYRKRKNSRKKLRR